MFVRVLAPLDDHTIRGALERTAMEVRGDHGFAAKLRIQDVLDRAGVITENEAELLDAVVAWDTAEQVVRRFGWNDGDQVVLRALVSKPKEDCKRCNGSGMILLGQPGGDRFVKDCDCRTRVNVPMIDRRIEDTVRRLGGWAALKDLSQDRYPFVKRDFVAEYLRWSKIESLRSASGNEMMAIGEGSDTIELDRGGGGKGDLNQLLEKILSSP